jgi:uncharacterized protein YjbI with pentapeptide repeats
MPPVEISLSPVGSRIGYWPRVQAVDLQTFTMSRTAVAPGTVLDNISLSAAAQHFIAARPSAFPARTGAMAQLGRGELNAFGAGDYSGAAFIGQDLRNAVFNGAILKDVNFVSANLQGARFLASVVTGANFAQADLRGADMRGAQGLVFAQIQSAAFDKTTLLPPNLGANIL